MKNIKEYHLLLKKYMNNECSEEEVQNIISLFQDPQLSPYLNLWLKEQWYKDQFHLKLQKEHSEELLGNIHHRINQKRKAENDFNLWKVAASIGLLLAAGLFWFYLNQQSEKLEWTTYQTQKGQRKTVTLPDGSNVYLNTSSSISFVNAFADSSRAVRLIGEAFFEVQHNAEKPFIVATDNLLTEVIGTSFNVNTYQQGTITVTVATGIVKVLTQQMNAVKLLQTLSKDQQIVYESQSGAYQLNNVNSGELFTWKDHYLIFEDKPLGEIEPVLERWYGVNIQFANEDLKDCALNIRIEDEPLMSVMKTLAIATNIRYRWQGADSTLVLSGNCNN